MAGASQPAQTSPGPRRAAGAKAVAATVGGYSLLLIFGLLQGLTGALQFSRGVGPVPLAAIGFALVIGVTSALCGRAMASAWGAIAPAVGWVIAAFAMALPEKSGSVIITNTAAGQIYLYGGALCAAVGVGLGLSGWARRGSNAAPAPGTATPQRRQDS